MAGLKTKPEYKGLAEAVSLGIAVLKKSKQNTWPGLVTAMGETDPLVVKAFRAMELTDRQLETINEWQPVLNLIQVAPPVIPAVCPACNYYVLTADTAPSRCMVTAGCEGKPFKVTGATGNTPVRKTAAENAAAKAEARTAATAAPQDPAGPAVDGGQTGAEPPAPGDSETVSGPYLDMVIVPDDVNPFD